MAMKYTAPNDYRAFCEMLGETENSMSHHGVKGMHWGERKYQNYDGSLTEAGRKHYGYGPGKKKHGDTGEDEFADDISNKVISNISKQYEFNKEYTIRDSLVKQAIDVAKQWDATRSNSLHINEAANRTADFKQKVAKGASIGAGVGGTLGIGAASAINSSIENSTKRHNEAVAKQNVEYNAQIEKMNTSWRKTIQESLDQQLKKGFISPELYKAKTEENQNTNAHDYSYYTPSSPRTISTAGVSAFGAIGGAMAGATVGGVMHGVKRMKALRADQDLKNVISDIATNPNIDKKTGLKKQQYQLSADDDMAKVNPGYNNWSDGTKSNCAICTATYALRRKGYDVTANGADDGYDTTAFLQAFPKATMRRIKLSNDSAELKSSINIPEGGYGNLSVNWKAGGGHSMVISVEGGNIVIRDTQSNKTYRGAAVNKILSRTTGEGKVIRLDNADPDIAQMKKMGMINPLGQGFKAADRVVVDINFGNTSSNKPKHGETGILDDVVLPTIARAATTYGTNKVIEAAKGKIDDKLKGIKAKKSK